MLDFVRSVYGREPALVRAGLVAVVVFVAAKFGVVLSEQDVGTALLYVLPVLGLGVAVRPAVTPVLVNRGYDGAADGDDSVHAP